MTIIRTASLLAAGSAALLLLAGCASAATPAAAPSAGFPPGGRAGAPGRVPGTFNLIADVSGTTLQVQGSGGQTAVTFTDATAITEQAAGSASDLVVGACVTVREGAAADASGAVAAASLQVSEPVNGQCTGFGGFAGGGPAGGRPAGMTPPAGMPSGAPSGAPAQWLVAGTIAAFGDGVLTVTDQRPAVGQTAAPATPTTTRVSVAAATITKSVAAPASAIKVGGCAWATGTPDSTGAVTATSIRLTPAVNGACTTIG